MVDAKKITEEEKPKADPKKEDSKAAEEKTLFGGPESVNNPLLTDVVGYQKK